jgi:small subunit ribosomal protein S16
VQSCRAVYNLTLWCWLAASLAVAVRVDRRQINGTESIQPSRSVAPFRSPCVSPGAVNIPSLKETIMVVIRLARGGAKKRPFFNIVVADSRTRRDGRFIERVGFYNPVASGAEQPLRVAFDRVDYWASTGAQLSPTVARLVAQAKVAA